MDSNLFRDVGVSRLNAALIGSTWFLACLCARIAAAQATGTVSGSVDDDSTGRPLIGVTILASAIKRQVTTDQTGHFTLTEVAPGNLLVIARRLGYEQQGAVVQVIAGEVREMKISMHRIVPTLDTVRVVEKSLVRRNIERLIDEHQRMGFGRFLDSTDLQRRPLARISDVLRDYTGFDVVTPPLCAPYTNRVANCGMRSKRVAIARGPRLCALAIRIDFATVTMGGQISNTDPRSDHRHDWVAAYDLASLFVDNVMAIEVFRRGSEVPVDYLTGGTECGMIQIWTYRP